jgi:hypothetical protein
MHVDIKKLPSTIQKAIGKIKHSGRDIEVITCDSVNPEYCGDDGSRGVFGIFDSNGNGQVHYGSWGGPNMFSAPAVDKFDADVNLPDGKFALKGSNGSFNHIKLYANATTIEGICPQTDADIELDEVEYEILWAHVNRTSAYRKQHYFEHKIPDNRLSLAISSLVGKGLIKQNKAGATSITTEGRNALEMTKV